MVVKSSCESCIHYKVCKRLPHLEKLEAELKEKQVDEDIEKSMTIEMHCHDYCFNDTCYSC